VRLTTARPRAIEFLVDNWSSAAVCLNCGTPGSTRSERVLSGGILMSWKFSMDMCSAIIPMEVVVIILGLTELWREIKQQSKRVALLHMIWNLKI
jgi:hypothetical protein